MDFNYDQPFVVVGGILEKDGKYLLVKEAHGPAKGLWNKPAGKWDAYESLPAGAAREIFEETGFEFIPKKLLGIYARHRNNNSVLQVIFLGEFSKKKGLPSGDVTEIKWFTKKEIMDMDEKTLRNPAIKRMIEDYENGQSYDFDILKEFIG